MSNITTRFHHFRTHGCCSILARLFASVRRPNSQRRRSQLSRLWRNGCDLRPSSNTVTCSFVLSLVVASTTGTIQAQQQEAAAPLSVTRTNAGWNYKWDRNATIYAHSALTTSVPTTFTGADVAPKVGADRFYAAGIYGQGTIATNIEAGHIWGGPGNHETLRHVTQFANHPDAPGPPFATPAYDKHATWVGMMIGGRQVATFPRVYQEGIAHQTDLRSTAIATEFLGNFSFQLTLDSFDFGYSPSASAFGVADVLNSSWGAIDTDDALDPLAQGIDVLSMAIDSRANENPNTTMVVCAGNSGDDVGVNSVWAPASGYNSITVGALANDGDNNYDQIAAFSSHGPQAYGDPVNGAIGHATARRAPIDIVAPGSRLTSAYYGGQTGDNDASLPGSENTPGTNVYSGGLAGTSYAAPITAAGVSLMKNAAGEFILPETSRDTRVVKANLLNAARKIPGWNNGQSIHPNGNGGVLTDQALDFQAGAGALDLDQTFNQYLTGQTDLTGTSGGVTDQVTGWDFADVNLGGHTDYVISTPMQGDSTFNATLTWFRERTHIDAENQIDVGYADLGLQVWDDTFTTLYSESLSAYTPVEHLSFELPESGRYGIRVSYDSNVFGDLSSEEFGLAWAGVALSCDFTGDALCDIADIDLLVTEIAATTNDPNFDLNGDQLVDLADRDQWLAAAGAENLPSGNAYLAADFNLDGVVDGVDFIEWNANKFSSTGQWSLGDANADGVTDGSDFIVWNANKFMSADGVNAVPEPGLNILLAVALMSSAVGRRRRPN